MPNLLIGSVNHQLDEKGRMRIPAKFRDGIGVNPFAMPGKNGCIYIVPAENAQKVLGSIMSGDLYSRTDEQSEAISYLSANTEMLVEDNQGRTVLPKNLKDKAKIRKDIVVVGVFDHLEVWAEEVYNERYSVLDPDKIKKMLSALEKRGV